ncbi:MAG: endonuclease/exonuclease/phosphatase family protein [Phycisphaerales bacterium]|nr:endonuclease/exonuclease/phosphatase family protein [Phycisphaerales bacterium]
MPSLRILSLNIRHGGGKRIERLISAVAEQQPDVVLLSEVRISSVERICAGLAERGLTESHWTDIERGINGLLALHKTGVAQSLGTLDETLPHRGHRLLLKAHGVHLLGVHILSQSTDKVAKQAQWDRLLARVDSMNGEPWLVMGDLNTGDASDRPASCPPFTGERCFVRLIGEVGADCWRLHHAGKSEGTWYSHTGNPFRLDHAVCSRPLLKLITRCDYVHSLRTEGLTDHSGLIVEVATGQ